MEHIKQEYPVYGAGDMRYPAIEVQQENGSRISEFIYQGHRIYKGKPELEGLPATMWNRMTRRIHWNFI